MSSNMKPRETTLCVTHQGTILARNSANVGVLGSSERGGTQMLGMLRCRWPLCLAGACLGGVAALENCPSSVGSPDSTASTPALSRLV
jgi:hypothetical protein